MNFNKPKRNLYKLRYFHKQQPFPNIKIPKNFSRIINESPCHKCTHGIDTFQNKLPPLKTSDCWYSRHEPRNNVKLTNTSNDMPNMPPILMSPYLVKSDNSPDDVSTSIQKLNNLKSEIIIQVNSPTTSSDTHSGRGSSRNSQIMRLAKDCWIDGDKEMAPNLWRRSEQNYKYSREYHRPSYNDLREDIVTPSTPSTSLTTTAVNEAVADSRLCEYETTNTAAPHITSSNNSNSCRNSRLLGVKRRGFKSTDRSSAAAVSSNCFKVRRDSNASAVTIYSICEHLYRLRQECRPLYSSGCLRDTFTPPLVDEFLFTFVQKAWTTPKIKEMNRDGKEQNGQVFVVSESCENQSKTTSSSPSWSPVLTRRRLSVPEIVMRKYALSRNRFRSDSNSEESLSSLLPLERNISSSSTKYRSYVFERGSGSDGDISSYALRDHRHSNRKRDTVMEMRKSTLLRRFWNKELHRNHSFEVIYNPYNLGINTSTHYVSKNWSPTQRPRLRENVLLNNIRREKFCSTSDLNENTTNTSCHVFSNSVNNNLNNNNSVISTPDVCSRTGVVEMHRPFTTDHASWIENHSLCSTLTSDYPSSGVTTSKTPQSGESGQTNNETTELSTPYHPESNNRVIVLSKNKYTIQPDTYHEINENIKMDKERQNTIKKTVHMCSKQIQTNSNANGNGMVSNIVSGSIYKPVEASNETLVPRYSAIPRSASMEVGISSGEYATEDSDVASLVDSLEDTTSPRINIDTESMCSQSPKRTSETKIEMINGGNNSSSQNNNNNSTSTPLSSCEPITNHDNKPVRGDIVPNTNPVQITIQQSTPRQKGAAFFIRIKNDHIVKEDENPSVSNRLPKKIKDKIYKRQIALEHYKKLRKNKIELQQVTSTRTDRIVVDNERYFDNNYKSNNKNITVAMITAQHTNDPTKNMASTSKEKTNDRKSSKTKREKWMKELELMESFKIDSQGNMKIVSKENNWTKRSELQNSNTFRVKSQKNVISHRFTEKRPPEPPAKQVVRNKSFTVTNTNDGTSFRNANTSIKISKDHDVNNTVSYNSPAPRRIYQKTEFNDGGKKIEILEIVECVDPDRLSHEKLKQPFPIQFKSKIPIPVLPAPKHSDEPEESINANYCEDCNLLKSKKKQEEDEQNRIRLDQKPMNIVRAIVAPTTESDTKPLDRLIAGILIGNINSTSNDTSKKSIVKTTVHHTRTEVHQALKEHANQYRQKKFEVIPEEKSISMESNVVEDSNNPNNVYNKHFHATTKIQQSDGQTVGNMTRFCSHNNNNHNLKIYDNNDNSIQVSVKKAGNTLPDKTLCKHTDNNVETNGNNEPKMYRTHVTLVMKQNKPNHTSNVEYSENIHACTNKSHEGGTKTIATNFSSKHLELVSETKEVATNTEPVKKPIKDKPSKKPEKHIVKHSCIGKDGENVKKENVKSTKPPKYVNIDVQTSNYKDSGTQTNPATNNSNIVKSLTTSFSAKIQLDETTNKTKETQTASDCTNIDCPRNTMKGQTTQTSFECDNIDCPRNKFRGQATQTSLDCDNVDCPRNKFKIEATQTSFECDNINCPKCQYKCKETQTSNCEHFGTTNQTSCVNIKSQYKGREAILSSTEEIPKGWKSFYHLHMDQSICDDSEDGNKPGDSISKNKRNFYETSYVAASIRNLDRKKSMSSMSIETVPTVISNKTSIAETVKMQLTSQCGDIEKCQNKSNKIHVNNNDASKSDECSSNDSEDELRLEKRYHTYPSVLSYKSIRKNKKNFKDGRVANSKNSQRGWSITVSGTNHNKHVTPDLKMRLRFPSQEANKLTNEIRHSDSGIGEESTHHCYMASKNPKLGITKHDNRHQYSGTSYSRQSRMKYPCLPDIQKGRTGNKSTKNLNHERMSAKNEELSQRNMTSIRCRQSGLRKIKTSSGKWIYSEEVKVIYPPPGSLAITGSTISPEQKPKVPTMSERDITRIHTPSLFSINQ